MYEFVYVSVILVTFVIFLCIRNTRRQRIVIARNCPQENTYLSGIEIVNAAYLSHRFSETSYKSSSQDDPYYINVVPNVPFETRRSIKNNNTTHSGEYDYIDLFKGLPAASNVRYPVGFEANVSISTTSLKPARSFANMYETETKIKPIRHASSLKCINSNTVNSQIPFSSTGCIIQPYVVYREEGHDKGVSLYSLV